ncbi:MAG: GNAT family N-acetyltransferase [Pseudomonadota bacterium]|nr:GNAT family N-acetyltransferase [Pseudomonadota bacterium]
MTTSPLYSADIVTVGSLTPRQRAAWAAMRTGNPGLASPYFTLEFAEVMAAARADTRVMTVSRNGAPAAFLPLHLSRSGVARPIGGPLGDHHGLITDTPDLDLDPLLGRAGFGRLTFHGALADQTSFLKYCDGPPEISWVSDLSRGYDAFIADCTAADAKAMRNIRSRQRKLEALDAEVTIRIDDRRPEALNQLIGAKREQYQRTRALDVFAVPWTRKVIDALFHRDTPELAGLLSTLEIDGKLAAAHFGMRSDTVLHYWFPVFWPEHAKLGPGLTLFLEMARKLSGDGITGIHLGPGDYDFKRRLSNAGFGVVSGQIRRPSLTNDIVSAGEAIEQQLRRLPLGRLSAWPGKALRRIDKWAALHAL